MSRSAVVVGAGIAGLCVAAGLAQAGLDVTILEQDAIDHRSAPRPGVPQSTQLHNLLERGRREIESLAPGFTEALIDLGANVAEASTDTFVVEYGVEMPRRPVGLQLVCAPRPILDTALRDCVGPLGRVSIEHARVRGLVGDLRGVSGVRTDAGTRSADLVIDASGARATGVAWATAMGAPTVPVDIVPARRWYVTAEFARPPKLVGDPTFWMVFPHGPHHRGALVSPKGTDRWVVSVSGTNSESPPRDEAGIREHASVLEHTAIAQLLHGASLASAASLFRRQNSEWRRVEVLDDAVPGLLFVGDSVASLNPLLGQGISSAAWQARLTRDLVRDLGAEGDLRELTVRQRSSTAEPIRAALSLATIDEREWTDSTGEAVPMPDVLRSLNERARYEPTLHAELVSMWHMLEPVDAILDRYAATQG